jgi:glyoxylase-like metal-dependent hydrolase (beta-lactamase superfamily II)
MRITRPERRRHAALLLLLLFALPLRAHPPAPLADGVWWLRGDFVPGRQPDGNSVILDGEDGLIVIDSGRHRTHSDRLLAFAQARGRPIAMLVNTHWHLDHVGGNPRLRAAHPALVVYGSDAIDAALAGFLARSRTQILAGLEHESDPAQRAAMREEIARIEAGAALRPDRIVRDTQAFGRGARALRLGLQADAVTAGDVWVFDPTTRTLIVGDLVTLPAPFLDTACPRRWQAALATLEAIEFERLVPGHGAPLTRAGFVRYRHAFDRLLSCAASTAPPATCVTVWRDAAGPLLAGHPEPLTRGLVEYYVTQRLRGTAVDSDCPAEP